MDRIEFHDSYLVAVDDRSGAVDFEAYIHRRHQEGTQAEGGIQDVQFTFQALTVEGDVGKLPADLSDGELLIDGVEFHDLLPVPTNLHASVRLTLIVKIDGRRITFRGSALKAEATSEYKFVELTE